MSNEEEAQTTLTCASDDLARVGAKMFIEKEAQTVFSYNPDTSNDEIRNELRSGSPDHDIGTIQKTSKVDDDVVESADVVEVGDGGQSEPDGHDTDLEPDETDEDGTVHSVRIVSSDKDSIDGGQLAPDGHNTDLEPAETDEDGTVHSVRIVSSDKDSIDGRQSEPDGHDTDLEPAETDEDGTVHSVHIVSGDKDSIDGDSLNGEAFNKLHETGSNRSAWVPLDQSIDELNEPVVEEYGDETQDEENNDDASVQTGIVLGTGIDSPESIGGKSEGRAKETGIQTKFGGYTPDQSDTLIVQELQTGVPVHSEEAVVEPPGELGGTGSGGFNAEDIVSKGSVDENIEGENSGDTTNDDDVPVENNESAKDSGAQTMFSYDPMISNTKIVDELANAYPKHSVENAVVDESSSPGETTTEDDVKPQSEPIEEIEDVETKSHQTVLVDNDEPDEQNKVREEEEEKDNDTAAVEESRDKELDDEDAAVEEEKDNDTAAVEESRDKVLEDEDAAVEEEKDNDTAAVEESRDKELEDEDAAVEEENDNDTAAIEESRAKELEDQDAAEEENQDKEEEDCKAPDGDSTLVDDIDLDGKDEMIDENKDENAENIVAKQQAGTVDNGGMDTDDSTGVQTMMTCASQDEYPKNTRFMEQNTQTTFSYNPDLSNTKILEELKTKQPAHGNENENRFRTSVHIQLKKEVEETFSTNESRVSDSNVIPELETKQSVNSKHALESIDNKDDEGSKEDAALVPLPETIGSENKDNDNNMTITDEERTDDGETTETSSVSGEETEQLEELEDIQSRQKIPRNKFHSLPSLDGKRDAPLNRVRAESYPSYGTQGGQVSIHLPVAVKEVNENDNEQQNAEAQTKIGFGTSPPSKDINEKASNTYFTYGADMSNSQIVEELTKGDPIHSQEAVSDVKGRSESEDSLFNDDWEMNESSGEGEIEVQEIIHKDDDVSDIDVSDVEDDQEVPSLVTHHPDKEESEVEDQKSHVSVADVVDKEGDTDVKDKEDADGKQKTLTQTDVSCGNALVSAEDSRKTAAESALSVHITFSFQTGDATKAHADQDSSNAAQCATLNDGNANVHGTIPILVTVKYEQRTDECGNVVSGPVIELTLLRPPAKDLHSLETESVYDDAKSTVPDESDERHDDTNPDLSPEETREIQIQTDLVLGNLLFSESISSVSEGGFDTASEGPGHDEELILPSVPLEEPSSRFDVTWGDGSLRDMENENGGEPYDDLHLLVDPQEACNQQYVQQLTPGSHELIPLDNKSRRTITKIPTEEFLAIPEDEVSSLTARNTDAKHVKVTARKLNRWGFQYEKNPSSNMTQESNVTIADDKGSFCKPVSSRKSILTTVTRILFEYQNSGEDFLSTDGRVTNVKSKIAFQILESKDTDNQSMQMVRLELKESMAPSKVMYMSNGAMTSRILNPQGSPLELPIDGQPLVLKLPLPQRRQLDGSSTNTTVRKLPFTIAQDGDEIQLASKDLKVGGSSLQFTLPLGDRGATMNVSAKIEDSSSDQGSTEFVTMTTTFDEGVSPAAKKPEGDKSLCKSIQAKPADGLLKEKDTVIPIKGEFGTPKDITTRLINEGLSGEKQSKVLRPGGSPLYVDLPSNDGVPIQARVALDSKAGGAGTKTIDGDQDMNANVSCKIIEDGVEKDVKSKLMKAGGSALCFKLPISNGGPITANVQIPKSDDKKSAVKETSQAAKIPVGDDCGCGSKEEGGTPKIVTARFVTDGLPGEEHSKVLHPGGSPMYVDLPSNNGTPIRARVALDPKADGGSTKTVHDKTNVSCKIIQDGVEKETKSKLMNAGGSALRFDVPMENGGAITANVRIPKTDNEVTGSPTDKDVTSLKSPMRGITETVVTPTGDRCFDIITEALATYTREIDPLRKALEEITKKVRELNMPELAGIGEASHMSYHDLDALINQPSPITYRHKITLRNGTSRISTTIRSGPNSMQNSRLTPNRNHTSYSLPDESENRCPFLYPPRRHTSGQPNMQQPRSYHHPSNKCPFAEENRNVYSPPHNKTPAYGPAFQEPFDYNIGFSYSEGYPGNLSSENYDYFPESLIDIRSRMYFTSEGSRSRERDVPRNSMHQYNPDTGYDDYCRPQWSPLAEMYIKLAQNCRSTEFYGEDEDSMEEDNDDYRGYGCTGTRREYTPPRKKKSRSRGRDGDRHKFKCRECGVSSRDGATSSAGIDLDRKASYWCDPEDVTGSTRPGPLVSGGCRRVKGEGLS